MKADREKDAEETKTSRKSDKESKAAQEYTTATTSTRSSPRLKKESNDKDRNSFSLPSLYSIIFLCVSIRVLFAVTITTSFTPDEYYQGVEEAYRIVYRDTPQAASIQPTWEWTGEYKIRSYALILPYMALFSVGRLLNIDSTAYISVGPRVLQAVMAVMGDVCLYKVSERLGGQLFALYALLVQLSSWSMLYMMSRTIANSTETVLILFGLYVWYKPLSKHRKYHPKEFHAYEVRSYAKPVSFLQVQYLIPAISSYTRPTAAASRLRPSRPSPRQKQEFFDDGDCLWGQNTTE